MRIGKALSILLGFIVLGNPPLFSESPTKVACVGDSGTFGTGIRDRVQNSYPAQLQRLLGRDWKVRNFGRSGATLLKKGDYPYSKSDEFQKVKDFQPDAVIIKLGTNDSKPQNWRYKEEFAADYKEMINFFKDLESKPLIWVCLPVPAYEIKWGISEEVILREIIPLIKEVAREMDVGLIDLHQALSGRREFFPDKIHPNAKGAGKIAQVVFEEIKKSQNELQIKRGHVDKNSSAFHLWPPYLFFDEASGKAF